MGHEWKIGDWCEYDGKRYIVVKVTPPVDGISGVYAVGFNPYNDREYISPHSNNPKLKYLPGCTGWDWKPEPTYRPFANGSEYEPNFDRKIREKASDDETKRHRMRIGGFSDVGIWIGGAMVAIAYEKAFDVLQFDDGTPFGIEVTK